MNPMRGGRSGGGQRGDVIPKGYQSAQLQQYTPEQMQLLNQGISNLGPDSYLSKLAGGDESTYEQMEAPAHRQFQGQLGQLGNRFSGMGMGARRSSGFQNTATAATSNFAQELMAKRHDLRRQAMKDLHEMSSELLDKRPYERGFAKKPERQPSGWGSFAGGLVGGVAAPFLGIDPLTGATAGSAVGGMF
jgi:hypothetical protein